MERDDNLRRAIRDLPEREPDLRLWSRIDADLNFAEQLPEALNQLPEFEPNDALWNRIEVNMSAENKPLETLSLWKYASAVAASVALLLVCWWLLRPGDSTIEQVQIAYSQEPQYEPENALITPADPAAGKAVAFIRTQCLRQAVVCQSLQFQELKAQLDELETQSRRLDEELIRYGQDPDLIKAQIKVENLKAEVTKELIQLLNT